MSVYTEMVRVGVKDGEAQEIAEAVRRAAGVVTVDTLGAFEARSDARLARVETLIAQLETRVMRSINTTLIGMTAIFAVFVGVMTAVIAWMVNT